MRDHNVHPATTEAEAVLANAFQAINDSAAGVVIGTALHTLGAIGLLGGLIGYVAWHRHVQKGHHHPNILQLATFLTYLAIIVNLLGGFMRTYETGHPGISDFGTSAWVRAIAIKHLFLFLGMGAAIYLFERVAPRHLKAMRAATMAQQSTTGHTLGVLGVTIGIVVAAVLGAVSSVLPVGQEAGEGMGPAEGPRGHDMGATRYHNASGQLQSTILAPSAASSSFDVLAGAIDLDVTLVWSPAQTQLAVEVRAPGGDPVLRPLGSNGRSEGSLGEPPVQGVWTYRIASPDAVANVQWQLIVRMPHAAGNETILANTVTIAPGQFYEINTVAPLNGTLWWDWTASATVHFDVHTHFDDEVQYPVTMTAATHRGSYTATRAGGHSYLWENTGNLPVTVSYRVWGEWELDSIFPPA